MLRACRVVGGWGHAAPAWALRHTVYLLEKTGCYYGNLNAEQDCASVVPPLNKFALYYNIMRTLISGTYPRA